MTWVEIFTAFLCGHVVCRIGEGIYRAWQLRRWAHLSSSMEYDPTPPPPPPLDPQLQDLVDLAKRRLRDLDDGEKWKTEGDL